MPKPCSLVEAKGWNRRVRTNSADMPQPRSITSMATSPPLSKARTTTGSRGSLASIAFWTRWASACSSAAAIGHGDEPGSRRRRAPDGRGACRRRSPSSIGWTSTARGGSDAARRAGRQAGEQVVHLLHRALQGRDHVGAEFGIVGVALGVAGDEAELADQILDVVHDEGEAAVELVEALGVGERLLAARLGDIGGGLDAGGAEQVEILPVEPAADRRDARG